MSRFFSGLTRSQAFEEAENAICNGSANATMGEIIAETQVCLDSEGPLRGTSRLFFRCPVGAELCGPELTPDSETFFVAVRHPGENGKTGARSGARSIFDDPSTRWPALEARTPPRPSIVAIVKKGGGKIAIA